MFSCWLDISPNIGQISSCASTTRRNNLTAAEFRNVEISQCVFDTLLTSQLGSETDFGGSHVFLLERILLDAISILFQPEDVLWTGSSVYLQCSYA